MRSIHPSCFKMKDTLYDCIDRSRVKSMERPQLRTNVKTNTWTVQICYQHHRFQQRAFQLLVQRQSLEIQGWETKSVSCILIKVGNRKVPSNYEMLTVEKWQGMRMKTSCLLSIFMMIWYTIMKTADHPHTFSRIVGSTNLGSKIPFWILSQCRFN